ncbi:hypothetical protein P8A21_22800 [Streptomyces poriferorum]|uniref:hypothetical protein n=1 Tax=Streptomyces poriferorum TaxID=2798799 RepID=UPI001C5DAC4C|nr:MULTISPECIES: hypothetical protein [Streptomyces]MBW5253160.1 hypothetical protein [Streptomyces poriferorum]MBW5261085.1 hypothetical protein [Streptomyces poriferorum]WLQ50128.1 hypothetical protein P8A21_22800 [Streptomyces sp. Alt1]
MTQSGQGDEQQLPAVRPAHEGVVLPAGGGEPWTPGGPADQAAPAGGQPWGRPWGPQASHQDPAQQERNQAQGGYGQDQQGGAYGQQQGQYGQQAPQPQHGSYGQGQQDSGYGRPQQPQPHQPSPYAQPLPPEAAPGGSDADATQYIAAVPAGPGPGPGGLPPEAPAESTQFLGRDPQQAYQQSGGHAAPPPQGGQDADATQYIPPVPGGGIPPVPGGAPYGIRPGAPGERQPPAEFDNLFRSDEPAGATQQMPRFDPTQQHQQHPGGQQQYQGGPPPQAYQQAPPYTGPDDGLPQSGQDGRRKKSAHVPLIAAVVVGCAVIGLGAGALMSGGDEKGEDAKQPVASASSPASQPATKAAPDPAKPQAEALDKLLADSNNSRSAVIGAVEKAKNCTDLDKAVADLKGAAQQRRDLVTRLKGLSVDKLPDNVQLSASLTKAWQASASADDHYAAWAAQAKSKKVCKKGKARFTTHYQQANVQSGEATTAKKQASRLWNAIATKYGLTKRASTAL